MSRDRNTRFAPLPTFSSKQALPPEDRVPSILLWMPRVQRSAFRWVSTLSDQGECSVGCICREPALTMGIVELAFKQDLVPQISRSHCSG